MVDQHEANRRLERYPGGVMVRSDGLLDWGFHRSVMYVAYVEYEGLVMMHGHQEVACFGPTPPIVWEHVGVVEIEQKSTLKPLRDYLTSLIGDGS